MQKNMLFMAVDLGTSFIKTGVYSPDGLYIAGSSSPVPDERPAPGIFLQRGELLYDAVVQCIRQTAADLGPRVKELQAIAFTGQMAGAIAVGENWEDITTWSCSLDSRYVPWADRQRREYGEEMYRISGTNAPVMCAKYAWFRDTFPEAHEKIKKYVMLNGYVIGKLSGIPVEEAAMDYSLITWTGMADIQRGTWSQELCGKLGIDPALLPRILPSSAIGGYLSQEAAALLGLPSGIPLVLGAGDKVSGCVGANILAENELIFEASSYGAVSYRTSHVRLDEDNRCYDVICGADPGSYYAHKYIQGSGIANDWFVQTFFRREGDTLADGFRYAETLAADVPLGSGKLLAIGLLGGSAMPFDSDVKGMFLGHTWNHHKGHFYKALLESFSYDLALTLQSLEQQYPACKGRPIKLIGGGARSTIWPQILADVTGHSFVTLNRADVALWGAALLAAQGVGGIADWREAAAAAVREEQVFTPDPESTAKYQAYLALYAESLSRLQPLYQKLNQL